MRYKMNIIQYLNRALSTTKHQYMTYIVANILNILYVVYKFISPIKYKMTRMTI